MPCTLQQSCTKTNWRIADLLDEGNCREDNIMAIFTYGHHYCEQWKRKAPLISAWCCCSQFEPLQLIAVISWSVDRGAHTSRHRACYTRSPNQIKKKTLAQCHHVRQLPMSAICLCWLCCCCCCTKLGGRIFSLNRRVVVRRGQLTLAHTHRHSNGQFIHDSAALCEHTATANLCTVHRCAVRGRQQQQGQPNRLCLLVACEVSNWGRTKR